MITLEIAKVIIYINENKTLTKPGDYIIIKSQICDLVQESLSSVYHNAGIRITFFNPGKNEIGFNVLIISNRIYQTYQSFQLFYNKIFELLDQFKNREISSDNGFLKTKIAVKIAQIFPSDKFLLNVEKVFSVLISQHKNNSYDIEIDIPEIIKRIAESLKCEEYFLKCHRTTKFHEIDIKLWEARQALACGLSMTSIVMLSVTLEECFKTILKNNYVQNYILNKEKSVQYLAKAYQSAEEKYGNLQMYQLIQSLFSEGFIKEDERKYLIEIKDSIRNAFIHSDKSKMFDTERKGDVDIISMEDNKLKHIETLELSILEMGFAQGIIQKAQADANAKLIFHDLEDWIILISARFWNKWKDKS